MKQKSWKHVSSHFAIPIVILINCRLLECKDIPRINGSLKLEEENLENNIVDDTNEFEFKIDKKYGLDPNWRASDKYNKYYTVKGLSPENTENNETTTAQDLLTVKGLSSEVYYKTESTTEQDYLTVKGLSFDNNHKTETTTQQDFLSVIPIKFNETFIKTIQPEYDKTTQKLLSSTSTENIITTTYEDNLELRKESSESTLQSSTQNYNSNEFTTWSVSKEISSEYPDEYTTNSEKDETTYGSILEVDFETFTESEGSTNIPNIDDSIGILPIINDKKLARNTDENEEKDVKTFGKLNKTTKNVKIDSKVKLHPTNNTTNKIIDKFNNTQEEDDDYVIEDVPEDYYDDKDKFVTKTPNVDAFSVIMGLAGSIAETVAERVLPKTVFDVFKRLQKQNEALEIERLRSPEENGGIGQFGRGLLKSLSSGFTRPLNQLMAGVRDIGSLDNDRSFVSGVASGVAGVADNVANVANSLSDAFKERVTAIYPGTLWCGDGNAAKSRELGVFFLTDTCCRQHDACKIFIKAGETKFGLNNTGIFTRSHCSCDTEFRECLKNTDSLISNQIGLTFFNVLGPQCFRKAHPIIKCVRRTRLTGQRCEQYELDYAKPKMWQWFDNETY